MGLRWPVLDGRFECEPGLGVANAPRKTPNMDLGVQYRLDATREDIDALIRRGDHQALLAFDQVSSFCARRNRRIARL